MIKKKIVETTEKYDKDGNLVEKNHQRGNHGRRRSEGIRNGSDKPAAGQPNYAVAKSNHL